MGKRTMLGTLMFLALLMSAAPVFAHHGSAVYDTSKKLTLKGVVTEYRWINPHVLVMIDAKDENGNVVHWVIENQAPSNITNYGWSKNTFKPGDEIVADVTPGKNLSANGTTVGRFDGRIEINGKVFKKEGQR